MEDVVSNVYHYLLYRTDTEQILGISKECSESYGISPMLIYGHPLNVNDAFTMHHIFGIRFEKGEEGRIAASLEVDEIIMTLDTRYLKDTFIMNRGSLKEDLLDGELSEKSIQGVEA